MGKSLTTEQLNELRQGNGSFGSAIQALKEGFLVKRSSDKRNYFIFIQETPEVVKNKFKNVSLEKIVSIYESGFTEKTEFVDSDILADDWMTIEQSVKEE
jgi:hypothetical protein